jgi:anti-sigma factor RsiW
VDCRSRRFASDDAPAYLDGVLPEAERIPFEAHLAECDGCAGYPQDTRRLIGSLHELSEPPADPATREALLRAFRDLRGHD